jgi:alpha-D-xyloside xylohydrolase
MKICQIIILLFLSQSILNAQKSIVWKESYPGIWKADIGQKQKHSLLQAAGGKANLSALARLPKTTFPLDKGVIEIKIIQGKTYLKLPLQQGEQLFGLGLNFQTVNQRGRILNLHMDHFGGKDNGRTHAPVPFYVSSKGYGVLIDAAQYITVYAGTGVRVDSKNPPELQDRNTNKKWSAQPYSDAVEVLMTTTMMMMTKMKMMIMMTVKMTTMMVLMLMIVMGIRTSRGPHEAGMCLAKPAKP